MAIDKAISDVQKGNYGEVPDWLKDSHYKGAEKLGRGIDYKYPHDYRHDWVNQQYLPNKIKNQHYYLPKENGRYEKVLAQQYYKLERAKKRPPEK